MRSRRKSESAIDLGLTWDKAFGGHLGTTRPSVPFCECLLSQVSTTYILMYTPLYNLIHLLLWVSLHSLIHV